VYRENTSAVNEHFYEDFIISSLLE